MNMHESKEEGRKAMDAAHVGGCAFLSGWIKVHCMWAALEKGKKVPGLATMHFHSIPCCMQQAHHCNGVMLIQQSAHFHASDLDLFF